jgi:hypothetical protein
MTDQRDATAATPRALFATEDLPFPALPAALEHALAPAGEHLFSTKPLSHGAYTVESFAAEAAAGNAGEDYAVVGIDGYGVNSWAVHAYLVEASHAIFVQLPWGGIYRDLADDRKAIETSFAWAAGVAARARAARGEGRIPHGVRLLVLDSTFVRSAWGWVWPGKPFVAHDARGATLRAEVDAALDALASGPLQAD